MKKILYLAMPDDVRQRIISVTNLVPPGMSQPQRVISTPHYPLEPGSMVYPPGPPAVPSNYYPAMHESVPNDPFPIRPTRASDLMTSPLSPLQPLSESATVYPVSQPVERTTFKEPILAPLLPSAQSTSASRLVSPIRITSAAECDCGVDH
jgi:hypothetical protein